MNVPEDLYYTKSHEWVRLVGDNHVRMGITDHAQELMGDIVYVELPEAGESFDAGENMAVVESVKAASDVYAPVTAVVSAVNEALADTPALINGACYDAWFVEFDDASILGLLTADEYKKFLETEEAH